MKILYLHQYFMTPAERGGTRSYEMARRFVAAGHEVHLLTSDMRGAAPYRGWRTERVEGITVHRVHVPYGNEMPFARRLRAFFRFAAAASVRAVRVGGDVVFATSTPLTIALPALAVKWGRRIPMVLEVRDLWPELPIAVGALRHPVLVRSARRLERVAYHRSHSVVALSPQMKQGVEARGVPPERVVCIPNSCDFDVFDVPASRGREIRDRHGWLGDRPLVLYAGTLGRINGVEWLAGLARALLVEAPEVRIAVVGDGMERDRVASEARAAGVLDVNLFMLGGRPKREITAWFRAADLSCSLFVDLPAMQANSANKFFDALASGTAVLLNYGGWQKRLVDERGLGLTLDRLDLEGGARRVAGLLADRDAVRETGERARAVGRELFDRDELAAELLAVLERAARA